MGRPKKQNREPFWRSDRGCYYVQDGTKQVRLSPEKDEAWRIWHQFMARPPEKRTAEPLMGPDSRPAAILDDFLDWCLKYKAKRTYDWYRNYLESFVRSLPAELTMAQVKPYHVQQWVDGNSTWKTGKRGAIIAVQRAFNWAVRMGLVTANPVRMLEKPRQDVVNT